MHETHLKEEHAVARDHAKIDSLPALDAHGFNGVQEITRPELVKLMTKFRPLSQDENADLDRGCPGLACVYQGLAPKNMARASPRHCRLSESWRGSQTSLSKWSR